jgi:hypothetical protein
MAATESDVRLSILGNPWVQAILIFFLVFAVGFQFLTLPIPGVNQHNCDLIRPGMRKEYIEWLMGRLGVDKYPGQSLSWSCTSTYRGRDGCIKVHYRFEWKPAWFGDDGHFEGYVVEAWFVSKFDE